MTEEDRQTASFTETKIQRGKERDIQKQRQA